MKIGLLFGGNSTEHEISIITMLQVKEYLTAYEVHCLYISKEGELYLANKTTIDDYRNIKTLNHKFKRINFTYHGIKRGNKRTMLDSVIILNHGKNGEDGMSASLLEFYKIPYVGSNLIASACLMDKGLTHSILKEAKVLVTKTKSYFKEDYLNSRIEPMLPCIIKPAILGSSIGISVCYDLNEFNKGLELAFSYDNKIVVEELLEDFLECNIALYKIDKIYHSKIEIVNKKHEILTYEDKYEDNLKNRRIDASKALESDIQQRVIKIAHEVYKKFNCDGIIRIDLMICQDKIYVNEVNTIPGALAYYLFDDFNAVISKLIKQSIVNSQKRKKILSSFETNILNITSMKK